MKLAIMQPYIFPYIGYFQLLNAVDKFVVYDDVNYIKQGWINRNNVLGQTGPNRITIPLVAASSNKLINQVEIDHRKPWQKKMIRTIEQTYSKAPHFNSVFPFVQKTIEKKDSFIADLARESLLRCKEYLEISTVVINSSEIYDNIELSGPNRVLDICAKEGATTYINASGGKALYDPSFFKKNGVELKFIQSKISPYNQYNQSFQPSLSILDVLMFCSKDEVKNMLSNYSLE